ncbi:ABC transporter permease [bacterium]|nr:ABC transporter permease [bacterium]
MRSTWVLFKREIIRFLRQKSRVIGAVVTPIVFWFLVGGGLGRSFQASIQTGTEVVNSGGYFEFFFPGILALSVLFTAIFSTISVIEDRNEGFLQGVLVSPVSRWSVFLSKILSGAVLGLMQGLVLIAIALVTGFSFEFYSIVQAFALLFIMGAALTALGFVFAWKLDSVQGYHSIMNVVLMPMWILSGAVFPAQNENFFFKWATTLNPLSYGMRALRESLSPYPSQHFFQGSFVMFLLFVACAFVAVNMMNQSSKSR